MEGIGGNVWNAAFEFIDEAKGAVRREGVPEPHTFGLRSGLGPGPSAFCGHGLRTGFLTSGAAHGASLFKMMDVSRQRLVDTPRGYVRDADAFRKQRLRRVRWGAPAESDEAASCKRYAPAAQLEKMSKFAPGSTSGAGATRRNSASASSGGLRFVRFAW
jgi:hypothetical protein